MDNFDLSDFINSEVMIKEKGYLFYVLGFSEESVEEIQQ
jgi:hypothetical protein